MSIQEIKYCSQVIFDAARTAVKSGMNDVKQLVVNHMPRTCNPVPVWLHDIVQELGNMGRPTVPRTAATTSTCITSIMNFAATVSRGVVSCFGKSDDNLGGIITPYREPVVNDESSNKDFAALHSTPDKPPSFTERLEKYYFVSLERKTTPFIDALQDLPPAFIKALDVFFTPSSEPILHAKNLYEIAKGVNSANQEQRNHALGLFKQAMSNAAPAEVLMKELHELKQSELTSTDATKLLETRIGTYPNLEEGTTKELLFGDLNNKPLLDCSRLQLDEKTILDLLSTLQHVNSYARHDVEHLPNLDNANIHPEHEPV